MSRKIILIKQELLLLVYELNRSGLLAENEKIRPILAQLEKLLLCDLSPSTNDSRSEERRVGKECRSCWSPPYSTKTERQRTHPHRCRGARYTAPPPLVVTSTCTSPTRPAEGHTGRASRKMPKRAMRSNLHDTIVFFFQAEDGIRDRSRHSC